MNFGERLSVLRRAKNLKQSDIATFCGVSRITVTRWESGTSEPSLSELHHIAAALDITIAQLLGEERNDKVILRHGALSLEIPTTEAGLHFLEKKLQDFTHWEKERESSLNAG